MQAKLQNPSRIPDIVYSFRNLEPKVCTSQLMVSFWRPKPNLASQSRRFSWFERHVDHIQFRYGRFIKHISKIRGTDVYMACTAIHISSTGSLHYVVVAQNFVIFLGKFEQGISDLPLEIQLDRLRSIRNLDRYRNHHSSCRFLPFLLFTAFVLFFGDSHSLYSFCAQIFQKIQVDSARTVKWFNGLQNSLMQLGVNS